MAKPTETLTEWISRHDGRVGLVLADVVESTTLLYSTGTLNFTAMIRSHRRRVTALIREFGGRLIDQPGDETLAVFPKATGAYSFAAELLRDSGHPKIAVRAGIHFGTVSVAGAALVGRNVHLTARVAQQAVDRELWISDAAKVAIEAESPELAAGIPWITSVERDLRGIPEKQTLWRAT
jgi:class 3 adenylate cyclase